MGGGGGLREGILWQIWMFLRYIIENQLIWITIQFSNSLISCGLEYVWERGANHVSKKINFFC
jgi:hypothetical protein